jgi:hypothetical protein
MKQILGNFLPTITISIIKYPSYMGQSPVVSPSTLPSNKLSDQGVLVEDSPPITPEFRTPEKASSVLRKVISASRQFQHSPSARRDFLFHYVDAAAASRQAATVVATKTKQSSSWKHWNTFLSRVGFKESAFLRGFDIFQQNILMSAFAQAVQEGAFSS